MDIAGI